MDVWIIVYLLLGLVALLVLALIWFRPTEQPLIELLKRRVVELEEALGRFETQHDKVNEEREALQRQLFEAQSDNAALRARIELHERSREAAERSFEEQKQHWREEMSNTMQRLLEGKLHTFDETSYKAMERLLGPFQAHMDAFKKRLEEQQQASGERLAALSKEIEQVMRAGLGITEEASKLTRALKGEKQTQGRWGEMILESVLEHSGLLKGVHYEVQSHYRDDEGHAKRPDVVVKLPQNRSIVIDAKVSLVDYDRYIGAAEEAQRVVAATALAHAFKNHIDTLQGRDYAHYEVGTLQYVFMFVPIEGAYALAAAQDAGLYEYALSRQIVIVYPSTLIVTLRTIYMYWQREATDEAVEALFVEAGKLYDKTYRFVERFEKIGAQIQTLGLSYRDASRQLHEGSGNLLRKTEQLRALGAKTTKKLGDIKRHRQESIPTQGEIDGFFQDPAEHYPKHDADEQD
ncbi:MAG: DNA recombination protein RmuC [Campylobacterales bacterium]|nr:DNA recombination protein RmuC [Campylobacterales bacterium]